MIAIIVEIFYNLATVKNDKEFKYCEESIMDDNNQDNFIGNAANVVVAQNVNPAMGKMLQFNAVDNNVIVFGIGNLPAAGKILEDDPVDVLGDAKVNSDAVIM